MMNNEIPQNWVNAVNAGNLDAIMDCYDENASLFATFEQMPITTREGIKDYFVGFTSREGAGVEINQSSQHVEDFGDGSYLATGLYDFYYTENGSEVRHPARYTFMVRVDQQGKIAHHHSSLLPSS